MSSPVDPHSPPPPRTVLAQYITETRLAPYLAATGDNQKRAIQLYQWNISLSGAVYESLHVFEVVLRNALDAQLCSWNAMQADRQTGRKHSEDWLLDPSHLLIRLTREGKDIRTARNQAANATRGRTIAMGHADLLAQMSFGTWRYLLPTSRDAGRQLLWDQALTAAFPHRSRPEAEITRAVQGIHQLRNRVAHLEPLLRTSNVRVQYHNMREVLAEINPAVEHWFTSTQRITSELNARP
ncbi:Abi family protein [Arthrobacter sp. H14]|uniref:Abi family protein n=1 Tax=Arthrobacter sp. H14 TaxID=1312959 RepID=UPI0012DD7F0E|nr:Abi family protein [Arthrobacter sp. H14]